MSCWLPGRPGVLPDLNALPSSVSPLAPSPRSTTLGGRRGHSGMAAPAVQAPIKRTCGLTGVFFTKPVQIRLQARRTAGGSRPRSSSRPVPDPVEPLATPDGAAGRAVATGRPPVRFPPSPAPRLAHWAGVSTWESCAAKTSAYANEREPDGPTSASPRNSAPYANEHQHVGRYSPRTCKPHPLC